MTESWQAYSKPDSCVQWDKNLEEFTATIPEEQKKKIKLLSTKNPNYEYLDPSVLYAIYTARQAVNEAGWKDGDFGINIGSSRGATQLFEKYHTDFVQTNKSPVRASPSTTLGNISTWVAQDLKAIGPDISHSITCSTALHALINGIAWLQSGMASKFLVGGSEAALTPFTLAQMRAMKLFPPDKLETEFPCRSLDLSKKQNTMVLGEGAGAMCLELGEKENALAYIAGIGYATETLTHAASLSANGSCFQKSMQMALTADGPDDIDAIVLHAPGTVKGDQAEMNAIKEVFGDRLPLLTSNKWKLGHTFGASGILSMAMAINMLTRQKFITIPYLQDQANRSNRKINRVLVNAVGFGGNAVSILLEGI